MPEAVETSETMETPGAQGAPGALDEALDGPDAVETTTWPMRQLFAKASRVAPHDMTVLITGETGVGKERLARWVHAHSRRADRHFVAVNCAAFPDSLLDTHLFGHARGAFTGAVQESVGIFEAAGKGTLFLDEIGEVSPAMQVKLLRVLQEREVQRVGEWHIRRVDVRLIAATNRDLPAAIAEGRFRQDLFYRLRVVHLHIPPLRQRLSDLQMLAKAFLRREAARLARPIGGYAPEAWTCLVRYDWPGNVRELQSAIEEACAMATGSQIEVKDLPETVRQGSASFRAAAAKSTPDDARQERRPLDDLEQAYIEAVLRRHRGIRTLAAQELGISLSTLRRKLRRQAVKR